MKFKLVIDWNYVSEATTSSGFVFFLEHVVFVNVLVSEQPQLHQGSDDEQHHESSEVGVHVGAILKVSGFGLVDHCSLAWVSAQVGSESSDDEERSNEGGSEHSDDLVQLLAQVSSEHSSSQSNQKSGVAILNSSNFGEEQEEHQTSPNSEKSGHPSFGEFVGEVSGSNSNKRAHNDNSNNHDLGDVASGQEEVVADQEEDHGDSHGDQGAEHLEQELGSGESHHSSEEDGEGTSEWSDIIHIFGQINGVFLAGLFSGEGGGGRAALLVLDLQGLLPFVILGAESLEQEFELNSIFAIFLTFEFERESCGFTILFNALELRVLEGVLHGTAFDPVGGSNRIERVGIVGDILGLGAFSSIEEGLLHLPLWLARLEEKDIFLVGRQHGCWSAVSHGPAHLVELLQVVEVVAVHDLAHAASDFSFLDGLGLHLLLLEEQLFG